ncbi:hypothetical protein GCM10007094_20500 [Pseudovibrio japonicus]|uniref:Glycine zipper domain-containing protein n=1 Tax=Pseudovibrio japonicus TaxID=366534 RepID=A0ABQ3EAN7_9HYPH|nr:hypothetical protein [Pseudovibrio japonicus]GHB31701.1 hypothetical protein GCM10007094_20500 [Pseudovibrio japonicus]
MIKVAFVCATFLALAACSSSQSENRLLGTVAGAGTGAGIAAIAGGGITPILAAGAAGGLAGNVLGDLATPRDCYVHDRYGRRVASACP